MEELDAGARPSVGKAPMAGVLRPTGRVAGAPDPEQAAAALVDVVSEVHHLERRQRSREFAVVA